MCGLIYALIKLNRQITFMKLTFEQGIVYGLAFRTLSQIFQWNCVHMEKLLATCKSYSSIQIYQRKESFHQFFISDFVMRFYYFFFSFSFFLLAHQFRFD